MSAVLKSGSLLSEAALRQIDREVAKYPADQKQSAVMAALRIAQSGHGWIGKEPIDPRWASPDGASRAPG